nr:putative reverse transcriptase, RNA-dependent DNA polymerase [Tanacetum cinerariifolium]
MEDQDGNMGFNESGEYKKTFIYFGIGTGSMRVLQGAKIWANKGLLAKAKGNILSMEIVRDHSGNTLRVSQSRFYNGKLVQTLLEEHSILLLEGSLSGDCDVKKMVKWSCIYAVGSQEYQMVCTRLDIASIDVGMLDKFDRGLQTDVQVFVNFDYAMKRSINCCGNLTKYHTVKNMWDALVITYNSERDKLQTFNLHVKANDIKQNNSPKIWTGAIIGRGTERQGLYYVDEYNGQGERECIDTLSWLKYVTYEEGRNHRTQSEDPNVSVAQEAPNLIPKVSNTHSSPISEPVETTNNTSWQEQENFPIKEDTSKRYALPPRENRGVLPKRYSPEKMSKGSRYPIANIAKGNLSEEAKAFALSMYFDEIPTNTEQALKLKHWKDAIEEEIKDLIKNNTWEKRGLPPEKKTVKCRWVFTIQYKPDGTMERYKARLVAKGYTQTYGIDYSETFSPVAKINTIRVLIFVAANKGWPLQEFDVKNAFLHEELKEEIYMEAPHGSRTVLEKEKYTFKKIPLWIKTRGNLTTCLIIYVDDMIITGNGKEEITKLKKKLFTEFEMKDLGRLKYFSGIKVIRSKQWIIMYQKKYVLDLLSEISMVDCKLANTPMIRGNLTTYLIIYVDDMIITGNGKEEITKLKKKLFTEFEMKDLGRLKYFSGIKVIRSKQWIIMYQKKYVLDLLSEISMVDCKLADTPMIVNQKLHMEKKHAWLTKEDTNEW